MWKFIIVMRSYAKDYDYNVMRRSTELSYMGPSDAAGHNNTQAQLDCDCAASNCSSN